MNGKRKIKCFILDILRDINAGRAVVTPSDYINDRNSLKLAALPENLFYSMSASEGLHQPMHTGSLITDLSD